MKLFDYKHVEIRHSVTYLNYNDNIIEKKRDTWFPPFDPDYVELQSYFVTHKTVKTFLGVAYETVFSETQQIYGFELDMYYCCAKTPQKMLELNKEYNLTTEIMQT